jgi:endonuclease/exonuclease/phosphatase family metal-dependent hydrolase
MKRTLPQGEARAQRLLVFALVFATVFTLVPAAHAKEPVRLRVLSWNVWGLPAVSTNLEARITALPGAIAKLGPDIVLLQEVWAESDGDRLKAGLAHHGYAYASHLAHTEYGMTGLFTASKLPLENAGFLPFASGRIGHSFWHLEWIASKGVGRFLVRTSLGELEVQNTHLQAQYDTDGYAAERLSQASEILMLCQNRALPLVLGGDFNSGSEELPRQALLDLVAMNDTTPSPRPDTIFVRSGGSTQIRVVESREALTDAVRLENGVTARLSDHPAVVVDLELSVCAHCASSAVEKASTRALAHAALIDAAAITPFRMTLALSTAATLLASAIAFGRRTRARRSGPWHFRVFRRAGLVLLAVGFIWTAYLGGLYYPARAKALRFVAHGLEAR